MTLTTPPSATSEQRAEPLRPTIPPDLERYVDPDLHDPAYGAYPRSGAREQLRAWLSRLRWPAVVLSYLGYVASNLGQRLLNGQPVNLDEIARVLLFARLFEALQQRPWLVAPIALAALLIFVVGERAHADLKRERSVLALRAKLETWKHEMALWESLQRQIAGTRVPVVAAGRLSRSSLKLGDDAAANFPYLTEPVQQAYDTAVQALRDASQSIGSTRGILVLGYANSGKTRLAFEALTRTLPDWLVLPWDAGLSLADRPLGEALRGRSYVVFIDDLQTFAVADRAESLRALLQTARSDATRRVLVVATCRAEEQERTHSVLEWLFEELTPVVMPNFSADSNDPQAQRIIGDFRAAGASHIADYDGTIGSLVLGLMRKRAQYESMVNASHPAATVLRAMKLLTLAGTAQHTVRRVRAVCAEVFGERPLRDSPPVWRGAVDELAQTQFVDETLPFATTADGDDVILRIRKDAYFEQVMPDYPQPNRPLQLVQDRVALQRTFVALGDAQGLFDLARALLDQGHYQQMADALEQAVQMDPRSNAIYAALSLGSLLSTHGQPDWARVAYQRIIQHAAPDIAALAELCLSLLLDARGDAAGATTARDHARDSGLVTPLEYAIAASQRTQTDAPVRDAFANSAAVYVIGSPAGEGATAERGEESDLLHFTIDAPDGTEKAMLPAYTRIGMLVESLLRNPEWQAYLVLQVDGGALLANLDANVTVAVDPWSPMEYQIPVHTA